MNRYEEITRLVRAEWGDNAVEYLVGALSSLCSENQLDALIENLRMIAGSETALSSGAMLTAKLRDKQ